MTPTDGETPALLKHVLVSRDIGGAERIGFALAEHFATRPGWRIEIAAPSGGSTQARVQASGAAHSLFSDQRLFSSGRVASASTALRIAGASMLARGLLHFHAPFLYRAVNPYSRLGPRLKSVVHIHLEYDDLAWPLSQPPDAIVLCANFLRPAVEKALARRSGRATRIHVAPNAVDTGRFFPGTAAEPVQVGRDDDHEHLAAIVANLSEHKGQHTAIKAIAALRRDGLRISLLIVGSCRPEHAGYDATLRALAHGEGVARHVHFLGQRDDVPAILRACDVLLLPSTNEGLPLSILEAQACGVVVLAAPTAGIPEVVKDGHTGFLAAADDPRRYAELIAHLIRNPALHASMRAASIEQVARDHTWTRYVERIESIYRDTLTG